VRLVGGDPRLVPWMLFVLAGLVSAVGPGAISTVALIAPLAAPIAKRLALPAFLVALVVANGANAGNLSPLSAVGIIANSRMAEAGLPGHEARVFAANFLAHVAVTVGVYLFWLWRAKVAPTPPRRVADSSAPAARGKAHPDPGRHRGLDLRGGGPSAARGLHGAGGRRAAPGPARRRGEHGPEGTALGRPAHGLRRGHPGGLRREGGGARADERAHRSPQHPRHGERRGGFRHGADLDLEQHFRVVLPAFRPPCPRWRSWRATPWRCP
jgi:hypothetical protein